MKKNQKIVTIQSLVWGMLFKNIIPVFFIGLICLSSSYIYNFHMKKITYEYVIEVKPIKIWVTENSLIDEQDLAPQNFMEYFIQDFFSKLPPSTGNKNFLDNKVSFKAYNGPIDVSNFIEDLNKDAQKSVYLNLKNKFNLLNRQSKNNLDFEKYLESFAEFPELYKMQRLERAILKKIDLEQAKISMTSNINELNYLINNFDELFSSSMYYSLNGWQIKSNKSNIRDVIVGGLLFWVLISSFFLFFKSDYFKTKLSN